MASSKPVSTGKPSTTTVTEDTQEVNNETLRLKLKKDGEKKKIQWTEDTVDNEGDYHWDLEFVTNHLLLRFGQEEKQNMLPVQEAESSPR